MFSGGLSPHPFRAYTYQSVAVVVPGHSQEFGKTEQDALEVLSNPASCRQSVILTKSNILITALFLDSSFRGQEQ